VSTILSDTSTRSLDSTPPLDHGYMHNVTGRVAVSSISVDDEFGRDDSELSNVHSILQSLKTDYDRDANPVHAWEAVASASRVGIAPPDWAFRVAVAAADSIVEIRDNAAAGTPVNREAECVGKALGFGADSPGRSKGPLMQAALQKRDRSIQSKVDRERSAGTKLDFAYLKVAETMGISSSTVRRAYKSQRKERETKRTLTKGNPHLPTKL